ncbi:hypothetical protein Q8A67_007254 [Cirrhinus molitorella]|uniref:CxC3 like cysteine cluster domain-containing protein n=1 Tax=Cirrhinus molitorella TaxID=172907 RepID=A0AA88TSI6_9TELE|nr:hypothetical protein Q8A67_007254 [Cirrhinus molitorella]
MLVDDGRSEVVEAKNGVENVGEHASGTMIGVRDMGNGTNALPDGVSVVVNSAEESLDTELLKDEALFKTPSAKKKKKKKESKTKKYMSGRYNLSMPHLSCPVCGYSREPSLSELQRSLYWPGNIPASILFATDVLVSFREMKMPSPGISFQAFVKMLDEKTIL